ncbi:MAG: NCS2 family permease [Dethiobacteria bacterium]|jgi:AGZA family xanthine/uracil permease-like MFS transporter|nr:NCS2 family permease [Bacillota bacterium]NMD32607.1 NCS2 family permease [Bacillota bacterium]HOB28951.1 NCS2 family permease [Bacillota bacterium]HPZ41515.1 NCS2 family permease [Bacillota bacterium]HQD52529.1 NCS2 family permease [Bacillota bacterium]
MEKFFKLKENHTDVRTEVIAGITTFMTMAYIIFVNPDILSATGMDKGAVMTATIIAAGLTTILMGLLTNYPFALASGMGLNAFFAFVVAEQYGWQAALGAVFISGVIFLILSVTRAIGYIDAALPTTLKRAVAAGIGLFIAYIGLQNGGIIVSDPATQVTLGQLTEPGPLLTLIGILIIAVLMARGVRGAILIGILLTTVVSFFMGIKALPTGIGDIFGMPVSLAPVALQLDLKAALSIPFFVIFSFLFVDIFDTMGTLQGTGARAGFLDEKGRLPRVNRAMFVDAIGTIGGSLLGTSTVTTYVESTAGVSEGGRTGLTAVVTGLLFFLSLFVAPLLDLIPSQATAPALVIVGVLMIGAVKEIDFNDFTEALPAFLTIIFMPLAYSIADGIAFGFIAYPVVKLVSGRAKEVHWLVYLLAVVALIHFFYPV